MSKTLELRNRVDDFLSNFDKGHKLVFGEPIEKGNVIIVTVAKVKFGFGYGQGIKSDSEGIGCGGGVLTKPIGYIEITENSAKFKFIRYLSPNLMLILAGLVIVLAGRWLKSYNA